MTTTTIIIIITVAIPTIIGAVYAAGYRLRHKHAINEDRNKIRHEERNKAEFDLAAKDKSIENWAAVFEELRQETQAYKDKVFQEKQLFEIRLNDLLIEIKKNSFLNQHRTKRDLVAAFAKYLQGIMEEAEQVQ